MQGTRHNSRNSKMGRASLRGTFMEEDSGPLSLNAEGIPCFDFFKQYEWLIRCAIDFLTYCCHNTFDQKGILLQFLSSRSKKKRERIILLHFIEKANFI